MLLEGTACKTGLFKLLWRASYFCQRCFFPSGKKQLFMLFCHFFCLAVTLVKKISNHYYKLHKFPKYPEKSLLSLFFSYFWLWIIWKNPFMLGWLFKEISLCQKLSREIIKKSFPVHPCSELRGGGSLSVTRNVGQTDRNLGV